MTEKGRNVLNLIKKYNILFDFNAKDISQVATEPVYAATLNSLVREGILIKVGTNPSLYRINKDFLYERKVEKLPNYIWELFEEKDNKIIKSKDFDIPIEIAPSGQMKFKTKQEVTVGTKIDFFDERIDNDTDRYMAWNIMNYRQDLKFIIFTFNRNYKKFLPDDWNNSYSNVKINILES